MENVITGYNREWPGQFQTIARYLEQNLTVALRIEHVGSTAIPGMAAKPILDIDIEIAQISDFDMTRSELERIGYIHNGDQGIQGREVFLRDEDHNTILDQIPHHLYVCDTKSRELHRHFAFRDYLREHSDVAAELSELKLYLVKKYSGDRELYIQGKDELVRSILDRALRWAE